MTATRQEAYDALDSERMYQDVMTLNGARPDMVEHLSIGDHLLAMEKCLADARAFWYAGHGPHTETLNFVRKVGGLAVRCMEKYGAPLR